MGMYTELHFNVELVRDTPQQVLDVLAYMTDAVADKPSPLPEHQLFATGRWEHMLTGSSYYFPLSPASSVEWDEFARKRTLHVRSDFKNYDSEIAAFLDWIMPWVVADTECLGYWRYEENDHPELIYKTAPGPAVDSVREAAVAERDAAVKRLGEIQAEWARRMALLVRLCSGRDGALPDDTLIPVGEVKKAILDAFGAEGEKALEAAR